MAVEVCLRSSCRWRYRTEVAARQGAKPIRSRMSKSRVVGACEAFRDCLSNCGSWFKCKFTTRCESHPLLAFLSVLSVACVVGSLSIVVANIVLFVDVFSSSKVDAKGVVEAILRVYAVLLAICVIFIEAGSKKVMEELPLMRWWAFRGLFYIFLGIIVLYNDYQGADGPDGASSVFVKIAGYIMVCCGGIYVVMEMCCMQRWAEDLADGHAVARVKAKHHASAPEPIQVSV